MFRFLEESNLILEEQMGCRNGSKGTKDQQLIDGKIIRDCKRGHKKVAWIDTERPMLWCCIVGHKNVLKNPK